jgi:hypothetical protein
LAEHATEDGHPSRNGGSRKTRKKALGLIPFLRS